MNTKFKGKIIEKEINYDPNIKNLALNAIQLIFFGNRNTRIIIYSVLMKSIRKHCLKKLMEKESEQFMNHLCFNRVKKRTVLEKIHFASLRWIYNIL